ncbi:lambda repressor-like DNA-binding domain protein [Elizabethkingia phage TCUEAP2]|nr:lambda repressor-like DNA-binding domain protein [Elizabethkingia phage TCUEAP2]
MELQIKEVAKEKGVKMQVIADGLGITRQTLFKQITGNPTIETLEKIATVLNCSIIEFFDTSNHYKKIYDHSGGCIGLIKK